MVGASHARQVHAARPEATSPGAIRVGIFPVCDDRPRVKDMDFAASRDEEVARALTRKSFSAHVMFDQIGSLDEEAMTLIRAAVMRVWGEAGFPPGAVRQATALSAELARLISADEDASALEDEGVSRDRQIALAEQASAFLIALAAEVDSPSV